MSPVRSTEPELSTVTPVPVSDILKFNTPWADELKKRLAEATIAFANRFGELELIVLMSGTSQLPVYWVNRKMTGSWNGGVIKSSGLIYCVSGILPLTLGLSGWKPLPLTPHI